MVVVLVPLVVLLVLLVLFGLIEIGVWLEVEVGDAAEAEAEVAPPVTVALRMLVVVVTSPAMRSFNTGLLLILPSSMLFIAALLSFSSSSDSFFFLHPKVKSRCICSTWALENTLPQ